MTAFPDPPVASARLGLGILGSELNRSTLKSLAGRSMTRNDLKAWLVLKSGSSLHRHLAELRGTGLIEKQRLRRLPRQVEYRLTGAGDSLAELIGLAENWLRRHPERPLEPASPVGWRAFAALADAWEASLLQRLVATARPERELLESIASVGDEQLEQELQRLLGAGLIEERAPAANGERGYALTDWCRLGIGLLARIARWEHEYVPHRAGEITVHDGTAALLATLPLAQPQAEAAGICACTVEGDRSERIGPRSGAVWAQVGSGAVEACGSGRPPRPPDAWMRGSVDSWLAAVIDSRPAALDVGGEVELAVETLRALHQDLYVSAPIPQ